jgi:hypothetical protein
MAAIVCHALWVEPNVIGTVRNAVNIDVIHEGVGIMLNSISSKWVYLLFGVLWIVVIAVADMNWPTHMGDRGALLEVLNIL